MLADPPRILIVDSQPIIRDGLETFLRPTLKSSVIVGSGGFADALRQIEQHHFDLVISDFHIRGDTVLGFLEVLKSRGSKSQCLVFSAGDEMQVGYPSMRAGAAGFVSKAEPMDQVIEAAETVLKGRLYVSESLARMLMRQGGPVATTHAGVNLSRRELEIFSLIGSGMVVSQIAIRFGISVKTVETHRENIKNKLGCSNASQVVAAAARWLDETTQVT